MGPRRYEALSRPALRGAVQVANTGAALAALSCVHQRLPVTRTAIEAGLRDVRLPGRFQILDFHGAVQWILDVAHNPLSAQTLADNLTACVEPRRTIAIFAALGDKDIPAMVQALRSHVDAWLVAGLDSPRALPVATLAAQLRELVCLSLPPRIACRRLA